METYNRVLNGKEIKFKIIDNKTVRIVTLNKVFVKNELYARVVSRDTALKPNDLLRITKAITKDKIVLGKAVSCSDPLLENIKFEMKRSDLQFLQILPETL